MFRWILVWLFAGLPGAVLAGYSSTAFDSPEDVTVDIKQLAPGILLTIDWNGHGVMVYRRTQSDIQHLKTNFGELADPYGNDLGASLRTAARSWGNSFASLAKPFNERLSLDPLRSIRPEIVVLSIASGYSGCAVSYMIKGSKSMGRRWPGGFYDPCRDVRFDLSGRVLKGHKQPLNLNLLAIPHYYDSSGKLIIGLQGGSPHRIDFRPSIDYSSLTPDQRLLAASEYGQLDEVKAATRAGADINAKNKDGFTALLMAILKGNSQAVRWLLEHGADANLRSTNEFTPSCLATITLNEPIILLLGDYGARWEPSHPTNPNCAKPPIIWAMTNTGSEADALQLVKALLQAGATPNIEYEGQSALEYSQKARYWLVEALLRAAIKKRAGISH